MSIETEQFQAFEPDKEAKAFIYQMVHELEEQVKNLGGLVVYVEKEEVVESDSQQVLENKYAVTFVVDPENLNLKVRAIGTNIFSACLSAKAVTQSKLSQLMNHRPSEDHEDRLSAALESNGYLH